MKSSPEIKKNIITDAFTAALKCRGGAIQAHSRAHQIMRQHILVTCVRGELRKKELLWPAHLGYPTPDDAQNELMVDHHLIWACLHSLCLSVHL